MREVVLDTETTGLDPATGDRIVEIGAVEIFNLLPTGRTYHQYINPERNMPEEAFAVHGLGDDFLADKPVFSEIADAFMTFIGDSQMVIHNASFDMNFINAELSKLGKPVYPMKRAIDTLMIARKKFPGSPASLDALCRRFNIDNGARVLHGALLDSEILAEVYLELKGGKQPDLVLGNADVSGMKTGKSDNSWVAYKRERPLESRLKEEEKRRHRDFIENIGENALWHRFEK